MINEEMVDKFIDYVNEQIEDLDLTNSSLAKSIGIDKNSISKYLRKERTMPLHVALKIANYFSIDISKVCGIKTEQTLGPIELNLIQELRNINDESSRIRLSLEYISITKTFTTKGN